VRMTAESREKGLVRQQDRKRGSEPRHAKVS
jgi:hypothetical protein